MSYILEALKKSEKERMEGGVPNVQTKHSIYPGMTTGRKRRFSLPVKSAFALLCISLAFTGWMLREHIPFTVQFKNLKIEKSSHGNKTVASDQPLPEIKTKELVKPTTQEIFEKPTNQKTQTPQTTEAPLTGDKQAQNSQTPVEVILQPSPIILHKQPATPQTKKSRTTPTKKAASNRSAIPTLKQLPLSIQNQIPTIKFAGHTYSAKASLRMIMINNSIMREGDLVSSGLRLEKITLDGIILNHKGQRFSITTIQ